MLVIDSGPAGAGVPGALNVTDGASPRPARPAGNQRAAAAPAAGTVACGPAITAAVPAAAASATATPCADEPGLTEATSGAAAVGHATCAALTANPTRTTESAQASKNRLPGHGGHRRDESGRSRLRWRRACRLLRHRRRPGCGIRRCRAQRGQRCARPWHHRRHPGCRCTVQQSRRPPPTVRAGRGARRAAPHHGVQRLSRRDIERGEDPSAQASASTSTRRLRRPRPRPRRRRAPHRPARCRRARPAT